MKLKISLALFAIYILSLMLTAPASLVMRFIPENAGVQINKVSGTLWHGKLSQINYRNQFQLQELTWKFDWSALLTLKAKADIKFNNGHKVMTGNAAIAYGLSGIVLSDVDIDLKVAELLPYLNIPVPVNASGQLTLLIENATQGLPYCEKLDGYLVWHDAKVQTPMGNIDLATPSVDLSCEQGDLVVALKQHSEQLTMNANVLLTQGGNYQLKGDIIGREGLDPSILQALSWIGPKNAAGETELNFTGRL